MQQQTPVTFHLYLLGPGGKIDTIYHESKYFGYGNADALRHTYHDRVKGALHADGSVVVAADVFFPAPSGSAKVICKSALQGYEDLQRWATNFSELHGDPTTSDCSIQIGGETLPAHKLLLMACSPVFRAMFTHPFAEESKSGIVKITDSKEPAPMRALLSYCYRGHLDVETMDGEWTEEIFSLACKYRIDALKAFMEKRYIETLSVGNVVAMAVFADTYSADKAQGGQECTNLIAREGDTVFKSANWKKLEEVNSKLTIELAVAAYLMK